MSSTPMAVPTGMPSSGSPLSSMILSWSSEMPNSFSLHIMPKDFSPRILASLILNAPGSSAPTMATATWIPSRAFDAPQTICSGAPLESGPTSTWQSLSVSAFGWGTAWVMRPTTTPAGTGETRSTCSTSRPIPVNAVVKALSSIPVRSIYCSSHSREILKGITSWASRYAVAYAWIGN